MFDWFAAKCPLDTEEKVWTERRMRWLADCFGIQRLRQATVIVLTPDLIEDYEEDAASVRRLLDRLCGFMGVRPEQIEFAIREDEQMPGAAGHYIRHERSVIGVARSQLAVPERLLATLAHELAHELLLGGGLLDTNVPDHEWVTDLLPVFLGTGIFLANSTIQDSSGHDGGRSWWSISRQGYLPARIFGYAFALFASVRNETKPFWAEHLRRDARSIFHAGLRFLHKTGDSLFGPDTVARKHVPPTPTQAVERLQTCTPTVRLDTLWDIGEQHLTDVAVMHAVQACLDDRDVAVRAQAAQALRIFGTAAEPAIPRLIEALHQSSSRLRICAAETLGAISLQGDQVIPELRFLLQDEKRDVLLGAATALAGFGAQAQPALPELLAALEIGLVECDDWLIEGMLNTLRAVSPDPRRDLDVYFADRDVELRRHALSAFRGSGGSR